MLLAVSFREGNILLACHIDSEESPKPPKTRWKTRDLPPFFQLKKRCSETRVLTQKEWRPWGPSNRSLEFPVANCLIPLVEYQWYVKIDVCKPSYCVRWWWLTMLSRSQNFLNKNRFLKAQLFEALPQKLQWRKWERSHHHFQSF